MKMIVEKDGEVEDNYDNMLTKSFKTTYQEEQLKKFVKIATNLLIHYRLFNGKTLQYIHKDEIERDAADFFKEVLMIKWSSFDKEKFLSRKGKGELE